CERGTSYTALIGLVNRSSQVLDCQMFKETKGRAPLSLTVRTDPGSLIAFNGSTVWHGVNRLGHGEERIVLSLSYRTDYDMGRLRRFKETTKDRLLFVGFSDFLPWRR